MDKKKITAIVIAGAILLFIIAVVLFLIMSKKQDQYIQISGRTQTEEGGVSVHYLEENSTGKSWEKNRTYSFEAQDGYSELTMFLSIDGQDTEIDLLRYLPSSKDYELPFSHESDGTKKLIAILPVLLVALQEGRLVIIDELDAKLHPKLLRYVISMFQNRKINRYGY